MSTSFQCDLLDWPVEGVGHVLLWPSSSGGIGVLGCVGAGETDSAGENSPVNGLTAGPTSGLRPGFTEAPLLTDTLLPERLTSPVSLDAPDMRKSLTFSSAACAGSWPNSGTRWDRKSDCLADGSSWSCSDSDEEIEESMSPLLRSTVTNLLMMSTLSGTVQTHFINY